jgi:transcriptional regulator with XRE-family HTH domain
VADTKGDMFVNLGPALRRARELRGTSQAEVARQAGVGKSQLSKYEQGKELPKLESLDRVLVALGFGSLDFFYALHLMDHEADRPAQAERSEDVAAVFKRLMGHLVDLHRRIVLETRDLGSRLGRPGEGARSDRGGRHQGSGPGPRSSRGHDCGTPGRFLPPGFDR